MKITSVLQRGNIVQFTDKIFMGCQVFNIIQLTNIDTGDLFPGYINGLRRNNAGNTLKIFFNGPVDSI